MTGRVRVIGVGSPFGADQAGWLVVRELRRSAALASYLDKELSLLEYDRPGTALLEAMAGAEAVYLVDAVLSDAAAGSVGCWQGEELAAMAATVSSHGWGVRQVLELGAVLGELPPRLTVYGITVTEALALCSAVQAGVAEATGRLEKRLLEDFCPERRQTE